LVKSLSVKSVREPKAHAADSTVSSRNDFTRRSERGIFFFAIAIAESEGAETLPCFAEIEGGGNPEMCKSNDSLQIVQYTPGFSADLDFEDTVLRAPTVARRSV
jgi:hypothetical protein